MIIRTICNHTEYVGFCKVFCFCELNTLVWGGGAPDGCGIATNFGRSTVADLDQPRIRSDPPLENGFEVADMAVESFKEANTGSKIHVMSSCSRHTGRLVAIKLATRTPRKSLDLSSKSFPTTKGKKFQCPHERLRHPGEDCLCGLKPLKS